MGPPWREGEARGARALAGRANSVWDYCEERIGKINAELNKRLGRTILIVAVLTLLAILLFGFGILHPKSVTLPNPSEPPTGATATSDQGKP